MKRLFKILGILLGVFVLLILATAIITPLVFDPNEHKDDITQLVKQHTGREMRIPGTIELSLFPWIGVEMGEVELGNAPGFGDKPFAKIQHASVRIKLLPLIKGDIRIGKIILSGLNLRLSRKANGHSNWDDLGGAGSPETPTPESKPSQQTEPSSFLAALAIGGIEIRNANVVWDDRLNRQYFQLSDFSLDMGALRLNQPFPVSTKFNFTNKAPELTGQIELTSRITLDLENQHFVLEDLKTSQRLKGPLIPGGELQSQLSSKQIDAQLNQQTLAIKNLQLMAVGVRLHSDIQIKKLLDQQDVQGRIKVTVEDAAQLFAVLGPAATAAINPSVLTGSTVMLPFTVSLGKQTAIIKPLQINAMGLDIRADLNAKQILDAPHITGTLQVSDFVPRTLTQKLGISLPKMADPAVLTKANFATQLEASLDHLKLTKLDVRFDDSRLKGGISVKHFAKPAIGFNLALDAMDVDRYLPPPSKKSKQSKPKAGTPASAAAAAAGQLPMEQLRALNISGKLRIGKIKVSNLRSTDIHVTAKVKNGLIRLHPLGARLYKGTYSGDLGFDVRGKTPRISMDEALNGVEIGPLLKDFMGDDPVKGKARLHAKLTARGIEPEAVRKTLNGNANFAIENGTLSKISIRQMINDAVSKYYKLPPAKQDGAKITLFNLISGSARIKNGLVSNDDLKATSKRLDINGKGTVNLIDEKIHYNANVVSKQVISVGDPKYDEHLALLKDEPIPLEIRGTISDPSFKVKVGKVLGRLVKKAAKRELKKKRKQEERKIKEKLENKVKDKLKKLFKF